MEKPCANLFPGAGLSGDEHGQRARSNPPQQSLEAPHLLRNAKDAFGGALLARRQDFPGLLKQWREFKRFRQIIVGTCATSETAWSICP